MKTFEEKIEAARSRRSFQDVPVLLDEDLALERERLTEALKTADRDSRLGSPSEADEIRAQLAVIDEEAADAVDVLRFTRLPGRAWAELTAKFPARGDVAVDVHYGYNFAQVCEAAAKYRNPRTHEAYAHRMNGDTPVELVDDQWDVIFDSLTGGEVAKVYDAIWEQNEYKAAERIQELVKASGAATRSASK